MPDTLDRKEDLPETPYAELQNLYAQLQEATPKEGATIELTDGHLAITPPSMEWRRAPLITERSIGKGDWFRTSGEIRFTNHDEDIVFRFTEKGLTFPYKEDQFPGLERDAYPIVAQVLKEALQKQTSPDAVEVGLRGVRGRLNAVLDRKPPREPGEKKWGPH